MIDNTLLCSIVMILTTASDTGYSRNRGHRNHPASLPWLINTMLRSRTPFQHQLQKTIKECFPAINMDPKSLPFPSLDIYPKNTFQKETVTYLARISSQPNDIIPYFPRNERQKTNENVCNKLL